MLVLNDDNTEFYNLETKSIITYSERVAREFKDGYSVEEDNDNYEIWYLKVFDDKGNIKRIQSPYKEEEIVYGREHANGMAFEVTSYIYRNEDGNEDSGQTGTDVTATVDNDTVYFDNFPIRDLVMAVTDNDTLADKIVEAVGEVSYKVGYEPAVTEAGDSIVMKLDPQPLVLSVSLPSADGGEELQTVTVEVKMESGENGTYAVKDGHMTLRINATEMLLDEGDGQNPVSDFRPTSMHFDLEQQKSGRS